MSESQLNANEVEDDIKIEIEDDTPPEDRNRAPLPQELVEELEKDDLEEYSDKVKKRLSQMKKVWHDERREKERFLREKDEALRFAQAKVEEVNRLKQRVNTGDRAYIEEVTRATKNELTTAKNKLKSAYESGDPDLIANAQEELTDVKLKLRDYERAKPALQAPENDVESEQQTREPTRNTPPTDHKAVEWSKKNTWFGSDEEMTALALGLHEKLVRSGVDPTSDEYYRRVDTTMRKRFPEAFEDDDTQTTEQEREKPVSRTKPANVVAPATRSTAPKQIRLTQTQVALAKRLGLTNEAYARELMKLENN
jgi:hypothetical protein